DILNPSLFAMFEQFVIDFAGTQNDTPNAVVWPNGHIRQDPLKSSLGALLQGRDDFGVAQETLWSNDDQRLAPTAQCLPTQTVEVLRRRGWIHNLQIVLDAQHEKTFEPRAGMLRSLAFKSVWQEQHQATKSLPFFLGAGDELIHDWLGDVPKVPKLRLPEDQPVRIIQTITVLEAQHSDF